VSALNGLHFTRFELLCLEDDSIQQLFLRLYHVFIVADQVLNVSHTGDLLLTFSLVHSLSCSHGFFESAHVLLEQVGALPTECRGEIQELRGEGGELDG
jgi:hypothetical protein